MEGTGELGYSLAKGNSALNQSSLALDARYPAEKYKIDFTLTSLFSRQAGAPATRYHTASVRYDRFLSPRSFAFALTRFERDDRQLLNLRRNLGAGLGWHFLTSDRSDLSLFGGFTFIHESFREGEAPAEGRRGPSSGEGLLRLDLEKTMLGPVQFSTTLSIHPNVTEPGRYRLSLESGLRVPGVSRFTWGLRLFDRFDSEPPIRVERNDYGLISSVGVTF